MKNSENDPYGYHTQKADMKRSRKLPAAASRAIAEAEERRRKAADLTGHVREIGGRGGKDPVRYGDWEIKGIACDF